MIRSARVFFLTRALREKLLLVVFVAIGVLWWGSAFLSRTTAFWREQRTTTAQLKTQAEWIKNQAAIEETARKTASSLDPARTLNGNQLITTILQLANEAGLKNTTTSGSTPPTTSGQLAVHSQDFTIRGVEWPALDTFYKALEKRSPYISIERFVMTAPPANSGQHTVQLRVTSVEIVR